MKQIFYKMILSYIIGFMICLPVVNAAHASVKTVAVVEVFDSAPSKELSHMRHKLENFLMQSKKLSLISSDKIVSYFSQGNSIAQGNSANTGAVTAGDKLFAEADDLFTAFKLNKALEVVQQSIGELQQKPGSSGNLVKAFLLKTQIEWELNKNEDAYQSMMKAVGYNLEGIKLDNYQYSPKVKKYYDDVQRKYLAQHHMIDLTIRVKNSQPVPIYVNGVYHGVGPFLTLKVPEDVPQMVAAGSGQAVSLTGNKQQSITVGARSTKVGNSLFHQIGIRTGNPDELKTEGLKLAASVGASEVVFLSVDNLGHSSQFEVTLLDVKKRILSVPKKLNFVDVDEDGDKVSRVMSEYIISASPSSFAAVTPSGDENQHDFKKSQTQNAKKAKSPAAYIIAGVLVVGAGVGAALALAGGSHGGGTGLSSTTTSLSGPVPTAP